MWPIHSRGFVPCCFASLWYCNNNIISVYWGLNLSLSTSINPWLVLHFLFSSSFRIYTNLWPSHSNQLNIIANFTILYIVIVHQKNVFLFQNHTVHGTYLEIFCQILVVSELEKSFLVLPLLFLHCWRGFQLLCHYCCFSNFNWCFCYGLSIILLLF